MNDQQILIRKNSQTSTLGGAAACRSDAQADWTGLRIVSYRQPAVMTDRHIVGRHPVLTLLSEGQMQSHMRVGLHEVHNQVQANDLMLYSGGKEIAYAHWQADKAVLISVELDPARLHMLDPDDARFTERALTGQPRFADNELATLMRTLWQEGQAGGPQGRLFADSLCLGLAVHVYRRFGQLDPERCDTRGRLNSSQLRRIDDYITQHLDQSIGLADLAQEVGLSRFHFTRVFSNTLGHSPYQHVIRKRLERAYQLLVGSEMSVADVALSAGFSSQAHFSTLCRRELGATPRTLREQR
ncbi:MAG: helix-turn-helix transcriptional regulator [Cytophagales bacterium]|nr:helix-turn-helix transcriptional regulator [Rhizobacter sp.]